MVEVSNATYIKRLQEQLQAVRQKVTEALGVLAGEDQKRKHAEVKDLQKALGALHSTLSAETRPPWLLQLELPVRKYLATPNTSSGSDLLKAIIAVDPELKAQIFEEPKTGGGLDLDGIFERAREKSRMPELFDSIVEQLEGILATGEVDSMRAQRGIDKLIATLKKSRSGSYLSVKGAQMFVTTFAEKVLWGLLEKYTGLDVLVTALRETVEELPAEMEKVDSEVRKEVDLKVAEIGSATALPPGVAFKAIPQQANNANEGAVDADFEVEL
jgi:hypothetical protein